MYLEMNATIDNFLCSIAYSICIHFIDVLVIGRSFLYPTNRCLEYVHPVDIIDNALTVSVHGVLQRNMFMECR